MLQARQLHLLVKFQLLQHKQAISAIISCESPISKCQHVRMTSKDVVRIGQAALTLHRLTAREINWP